MGDGSGNVFIDIVAPLIGNILGVIMLMAPTPAVLRARRERSLGSLNFLPYPGTALNCIGWTIYAFVIQNLWLVPANVIGLCGGVWFTLVTLPLVDLKWQDRITGLFVGAFLFFSVFAAIGSFAVSEDAQKQMWGIECVVVLLVYYVLPLSTMWEVIKTRNSASIYLPLAVAAIANGTMWTLYGLLAIKDLFVWMPNMVGAILGCVQCVLRFAYPSRPDSPSPVPTECPSSGSENGGVVRQGSGMHLLSASKKFAPSDVPLGTVAKGLDSHETPVIEPHQELHVEIAIAKALHETVAGDSSSGPNSGSSKPQTPVRSKGI